MFIQAIRQVCALFFRVNVTTHLMRFVTIKAKNEANMLLIASKPNHHVIDRSIFAALILYIFNQVLDFGRDDFTRQVLSWNFGLT